MLRTWDLIISVRSGSGTVAGQIVQAIIEEIQRGRIAPGSALPGTRELAKILGINRKTVIVAYDELTAQGWLSPEKARGTFVSSEIPGKEIDALRTQGTHVAGQTDYPLSDSTPIVPLIFGKTGFLTIDDGAPDTRLVPVADLSRAWRKALFAASRRNQLGYGDPRGSLNLRQQVLAMLSNERGLSAETDNVCLVRGSQMGIYITARVLIRPGDVVVVEELSYPPAREAFRCAGAEVVSIKLDENGMCVDELETLCRRKHVRAVYVTPHHQFPTTVLMPAPRRLRLLALAEQFGFAIIEDDYDHEFHFTHRPMLPLASIDRWGKVIYIGSLSKLLSPSLRLGYLVAPETFIERAANQVALIDRQGDPVTEAAVAELMKNGNIRSHTKKVMKIYAERRIFLANLINKYLAKKITFNLPTGGLALWLQFDQDVNMLRLQQEVISQKLQFLPADSFSSLSQPVSAIRFGFGSLNEQEVHEAVLRLHNAVMSSLEY
ncbi:PLP-dependent aminotransferase family protein [Acidithiobacillus sp. RW2]|uniref:PLP-dependent aminotransferase family protein n=1 Tax=Acidithiobacillus sulfurivorans TaxID=1958756 RepID=A0ABS5ZYE3_9PROT|nr:PLP-dependent aminotransferase family protein [Acidithiobacillus sulfurivorans]